jgi:uncharacterized protein (DUF1015 family)
MLGRCLSKENSCVSIPKQMKTQNETTQVKTMTDFRPFRPWRYNMEKVKADDVLAPPYDVISSAGQDALYEKSDYNCIRLILNKILDTDTNQDNRYTRAKVFFDEWKAKGILIQEEKPRFYLYQQTFADLADGSLQKRTAFLGALKIEAFEKGIVIPHEKTLDKPKADRLALLKETKTNFSPIFGLFADQGGELVGLLPKLTASNPLFSVKDEAGVSHTLWVIESEKEVNKISENLSSQKVYIADGHHRYTTALNYSLEKRKEAGNPEELLPSDFIYMALVSFQDSGLALMPTHRLITGLSDFNKPKFLKELERFFTVESVRPKELQKKIDKTPDNPSVIGVIFSASEGYLLTLKDPESAKASMLPNKPEVWYQLDTNVLAYLIFKTLLGLGESDWEEYLQFTHADHEAIEKIETNDDIQVGFLLKAPRVEILSAMGAVRELMPQKSTYFYPKLASGLLFFSHDGENVI